MGSRYKVVDLEEKDKKYIYSAGTTYLCSYLLRMIILNQGTHLLRKLFFFPQLGWKLGNR